MGLEMVNLIVQWELYCTPKVICLLLIVIIIELSSLMKTCKAFGSEGNGNSQFKCPCGIAVDADDNIVVNDYNNHSLQLLSKDGNWKKTIGKKGFGDGEFDCPFGVAVCKTSGIIFASNFSNHCVQFLNSDGKFLFKFGSKGSENGQLSAGYLKKIVY